VSVEFGAEAALKPVVTIPDEKRVHTPSMNVGFIGLTVVFILGLVILLPIWPWGRTANAADWRALYESAMSEGNPNARLGWNIYNAQRAVRLRQKEIRNQPPESSERLELVHAETTLIDLKARKVRWFRSGMF
jgi:hypothetical protein